MGECNSVCRPICEEHKKIEDLAARSHPQRREIILQPFVHQKQKNCEKTDSKTNVAGEEKAGKGIIESFPSHSTEQSLSRETKVEEKEVETGERKQHRPEDETKIAYQKSTSIEQKSPQGMKKTNSFAARDQHSMNSSINVSHLPEMQSISPKLYLPSEIHESLLERWNQSNYEPSKLFTIIDYDAIFDPK